MSRLSAPNGGLKRILKTGLRVLLTWTPLRKLLHAVFFFSLENDPDAADLCELLFLTAIRKKQPDKRLCRAFAGALEDAANSLDGQGGHELWQRMEPLFTVTRRRLFDSPLWRYGPRFVMGNVAPVFKAFQAHGVTVPGKVYCDLGCGEHHPYGTAAIMYLNGALETISVDLKGTEERRAAEALYDLLLVCRLDPEPWHCTDVSRQEFWNRLAAFDLKALGEGNLQRGLASVPLKHVVTDVYTPDLPLGRIDLMSSRAVLEHLLRFDDACASLFRLMAPGGVAYHMIDLVDHRAYGPTDCHWWSFLAADKVQSECACNRLRPQELRDAFERAGFDIRQFEALQRGEMPETFRAQLAPHFAAMPHEELRILKVACVLRKPRSDRQ